MHKDTRLIVACLFFIGIVVYSVFEYDRLTFVSPVLSTTQKTTVPVVTAVDSTKLPERFPADFPIEAGAQILNNYNAEDGVSIQATRKFVSSKTLKENFVFYFFYFNKNGWELKDVLNDKTTKSMFAEKGSASLTLTMTEDIKTKKSIVDVSFVSKK
jgi:hypothetical protein